MVGKHSPGPAQEQPASFGEVFGVAEFRAIWGAQGLSLIGDWLAQVALAILVFERTGSALLSALTYALIFLPQIIGGPFLAGLADMFPRRTVMVVCDIARAVLVAVMAIPGMPFWSLCLLLFGTHLLLAPFAAARSAILPDVLTGDRYVLGLSVTNITYQAAQVVGFVVGGAVVGLLGSRNALAVDAVTFLVSALLLQLGVRHRPAAKRERQDGGKKRSALLESSIVGARLVFGDRRLRALVAMAWLCAFYVVPEGLATPYAATLGGAALTVGLLMAAMPLGTVAGAIVIGRFVSPSKRLRLMGPLALLSCGPLIATAFFPGLGVTLAILVVVGFASAYQLPANAAFVAAVPDSGRGQAFGLVQGGIYAFQGLAIVSAGALAEVLAPQYVVAIAGATGLVVALWAAVTWSRVPQQPDSMAEAAPATAVLPEESQPETTSRPGVRR